MSRYISISICLLLALVTLLVYLPARHHEFVAYDDPEYVTENPVVQAGLTWPGIQWAFTTGHASNWHPLTWLTHMLDAQLFGASATGPHLVNVFLHVANTLLLFGLLRSLTTAVWRSAFVAALFALHPLHVESVAWIAERKDVLSAFFFLLTLLVYVRYARKWSRVESRESRAGATATLDSRPSTLDYCAALLLFACGLMSKPMLVTLPFVLLLLDYWPLRRIGAPVSDPAHFGKTDSNPPGRRPALLNSLRHWTLWPLLREKIPFFALSVISSVITLLAQQHGGAVQSVASFSVSERLQNALVAVAVYLAKTFWPTDLAVFYPHPGSWPVAVVVTSALLLLGVSAGVLWLSRRFPFAAFGWLWFVGMIIPVIGLVQVGGQAWADRYTYLPLIGVFIALVWGVGVLLARRRVSPRLIGLAATVVLVASAVRTENQLGHWRTSESLFRHALAVTKDNFLAHNNLANVLFQRGQWDKAIVHYQAALRLKPDYADAHSNFAVLLVEQGRAAEAIIHCRRALELRPGVAETHNNLANALRQDGQNADAIYHYQQALKLRPDLWIVHSNLGILLFENGRANEAIQHFEMVLQLAPDHMKTRGNLGTALLSLERNAEAFKHFQTALQLQPDNAEAHNNLGWCLLRLGRVDEAVVHFQTALQLEPNFPNPHFNLGNVLLKSGRTDEAIAHFRKVLEMQPDHPEVRRSLTLALNQKRTPADSSFRATDHPQP